MEDLSIEVIIEQLGFIKALASKAKDYESLGKEEVKAKNLSITTKTGIINTSSKKAKAYSPENEKKIERIKRKASEAIAAIPYKEVEIEAASTRITPTTIVDDDAALILKVLLDPNTKNKAIALLKQLA